MAQAVRYTVTTDTSHFTALQLQARTLLSIAWNGYAHWIRDRVVSLPRLLTEHRLGMVITGARIRYGDAVTLFDADTLEVEVDMHIWAGQLAVLDVDVRGAGRHAASIRLLLCPLEIKDPKTLAAVPTRIPEHLLNRFQSEPVGSASSGSDPPKTGVVEMVERIEKTGRSIAECMEMFTIHRHNCEVAEQWSFIEIPAIVESVREPLALEQHDTCPELRVCLRKGLRSYNCELYKPFYVFERGQVKSRAFVWDDKLVFIHHLLSDHHQGSPGDIHATIIEEFY